MKRTPPILGIIVFITSILLVIGFAVLAFLNRDTLLGSETSQEGQSSQPTGTAPTPSAVTTPIPSQAEGLDSATPSPEPTKPPTETNGLGEENLVSSITITRAAVENETLVVRTIISTTEPGTCSMIVGLSDGSFFTSETVETVALNGNSACNGFDIPFTTFLPAAGVSDVEVRFQNESGQSITSGAQSL